jgi:FKBP-type peptidyl-prolyl cis-trans isomerase
MLKYTLLLVFICFCATLSAQVEPLTTEHGYRFYHHVKKSGQKPKKGESIRAYVHVFIGDTLLSSSRKNLAGGLYKFDIAPEGVMLDHYPPLMDASLLMGIGDSATIFQPIDTSMRKFVPKEVQHITELRFEIVLMQIISQEEKDKTEKALQERADAIKKMAQTTVDSYRSGALENQLTTTKSGLKYLVVEKGKGKPIQVNEAVQVHYYGFLTNGNPFDNSFDRRQPLAFPAGSDQMIPGFDEGIMLLNHGAKAYLFLPSSLAYGEQETAGGLIPANSELVFYIEVL